MITLMRMIMHIVIVVVVVVMMMIMIMMMMTTTTTMMMTLDRMTQTTIFRLLTGHCGQRNHLKRLGLADSAHCECGSEEQSPERIP